jgi:hypothetical protein
MVQRNVAPVIHRKKFDGGRRTPEEVHAQLAFPPGSKCSGCGRPPLTRAIVMMELNEALKNPDVDAIRVFRPAEFVKMLIQIKGSDGLPRTYLRASVAFACKACTPAMEKQLAKAPSHCIVEFNRGPGTERVVG